MKRNIEVEMISELKDSYGDTRTTVDFASLGIPLTLARELWKAFEALTGQNSLETRRQTWRCLRKFAKFFREAEALVNRTDMPSDILMQFRTWLSTQNLINATRQSHFNDVRRTLEWINRNSLRAFVCAPKLDIPTFPRDEPEILPNLPRPVVKEVLSFCYEQIDRVVARLEYGEKIRKGEDLCNIDYEKHRVLARLLELGDGRIPTQNELNGRSRVPRKGIARYGLRNLRRLLSPGPEDIFPFYLAILIQCAGNPMAIRDMKRDCVRNHPLRKDRQQIVWMKERAGREQVADFTITRPRNAPLLVKQLLELNKNGINRANPRDRNNLFLAEGNNGYTVPCIQLLHVMLDDFIKRNELPSFDFKQFRTANAVFHVEETNDLDAGRRRLNHKLGSTTVSYVRTGLVQQNDRLISKFQGQLIEESSFDLLPTASEHKNEPSVGPASNSADTVFGFRCRDPFAGIAPEVKQANSA